jgi:hypothetical protein
MKKWVLLNNNSTFFDKLFGSFRRKRTNKEDWKDWIDLFILNFKYPELILASYTWSLVFIF